MAILVVVVVVVFVVVVCRCGVVWRCEVICRCEVVVDDVSRRIVTVVVVVVFVVRPFCHSIVVAVVFFGLVIVDVRCGVCVVVVVGRG